jgi:hypothetical protein
MCIYLGTIIRYTVYFLKRYCSIRAFNHNVGKKGGGEGGTDATTTCCKIPRFAILFSEASGSPDYISYMYVSGGGGGGIYILLVRTCTILYELSLAYLCKKLHAPAQTAPLLAACLKEHHWQSFSLRKSVGVFF